MQTPRRLALSMTVLALSMSLSTVSATAAAEDAAPGATDPLRSPACRSALAALQAQEAAAANSSAAHGSAPQDSAARGSTTRDSAANGAAAHGSTPNGSATEHQPTAASPAYAAARRQAAIACLASRADPPPQPQRLAQPPVVVPPLPAVQPIQPLIPSTRPALPTALPASPEPPRFVLSCDSAGCWANDGSRLNRVGPNLWGSRGACMQQGALLQCP